MIKYIAVELLQLAAIVTASDLLLRVVSAGS